MNNNVMYIVRKRRDRKEFRKNGLFKKTNYAWNKGYFNKSKVIGSLMKLIEESEANTFADWVNYYFESGEKRQTYVDELVNEEDKEFLRNLYRIRTTRYMQDFADDIDVEDLKNCGRTLHELKQIATQFQNELKNVNIEMTFEQALDAVLIRVLDETWIGYHREKEAKKSLRKIFSKEFFVNPTPTQDSLQCVDFICVDRVGVAKLAFQIKSDKGKHLRADVLEYNRQGHEQFSLENGGAPVFYVLADEKGFILNLPEIREAFKKHA